jgi:uncharacterized protein with gpF-like domain
MIDSSSFDMEMARMKNITDESVNETMSIAKSLKNS